MGEIYWHLFLLLLLFRIFFASLDIREPRLQSFVLRPLQNILMGIDVPNNSAHEFIEVYLSVAILIEVTEDFDELECGQELAEITGKREVRKSERLG